VVNLVWRQSEIKVHVQALNAFARAADVVQDEWHFANGVAVQRKIRLNEILEVCQEDHSRSYASLFAHHFR
jgi:hypothetical protein